MERCLMVNGSQVIKEDIIIEAKHELVGTSSDIQFKFGPELEGPSINKYIQRWIDGATSFEKDDMRVKCGDVIVIEGNMDDCKVTNEERNNGINIQNLIKI